MNFTQGPGGTFLTPSISRWLWANAWKYRTDHTHLPLLEWVNSGRCVWSSLACSLPQKKMIFFRSKFATRKKQLGTAADVSCERDLNACSVEEFFINYCFRNLGVQLFSEQKLFITNRICSSRTVTVHHEQFAFAEKLSAYSTPCLLHSYHIRESASTSAWFNYMDPCASSTSANTRTNEPREFIYFY